MVNNPQTVKQEGTKMSEVTTDETAPKVRMSKRERRVLEDQTTYARSVKRLAKVTKERDLAQGAQERATARLNTAQEKLDRYTQDRDDALAMLTAAGAEVPVVELDDESETENEENTDGENDESENDEVSDNSDETDDVLV